MPSDRATSTTQGRKYQGYPYVNPPAFGVPTIDPYTAARWANLPRRAIGTAVRVEDQPRSSGTQRNQTERGRETTENKQDAEETPVGDVNLPDTSDNSTSEARYQNNTKSPEESMSYRSDDEPVLYIEMPEEGESDIYVRTPSQQDPRRLNQTTDKDDDEPVVYIDIPECSGSGVSERRPEVEDGPSTSVVQETIFYDQFKDRRIDVIPGSWDADDSSHSSSNSTMRRTRRPGPPTSLNLWSPGNADTAVTSSPRPAPTPPSYLTPEEYHQRVHQKTDDDFRLSPLPVTEFPDPPPAYSEIDLQNSAPNFGTSVPNSGASGNLGSTGNHGSPDQPAVQRTRVIINADDSNRKYLTCTNCQMMVHSLVVRQTSLETHLAAILSVLCGLIPCAVMIYCCDFCDFFKSKVHYCPNCNEVITSESWFKHCP